MPAQEGFGFFLLGAMCLVGLVLLALYLGIGALGVRGLAGLLASRGHGRSGRVSVVLVIASVLLFLGLSIGLWRAHVGWYGPTYRVGDQRLRPYLSAMEAVDRASLGFTPIPPDAKIRVVPVAGEEEYDVHLQDSLGQRNILFRENAEGSYEWVGESQAFMGPRRYDTGAGIRNEQIVIAYYRVPVSWAALNQVQVYYSGDDPRLKYEPLLTLKEARGILQEWSKLRVSPAP